MSAELSNLPEGCVANVIALTNPREACHFTVVSTLFRSAADSDAVWERLLPPDYQDIIAQSDADTQKELLTVYRPKKQLFMRLADSPVIIDAGCKSFFLDKASGKKCIMITAREMAIVWGDTPSYWEWISLPDSRSGSATQHMLARDITPNRSFLTVSKNNIVSYLVFILADNSYGLEHTPVETSIGMANGAKNTKTLFLAPEDGVERQLRRRVRRFLFNRHTFVEASSANSGANGQYPKRRRDGWMEAELVEIFIDGGDNCDFVEVSVTEVRCGNWKRGLVVEGIEFRPKA